MQAQQAPGRLGATKIAYSEDNPRAKIAKVCREHPTAGVEELISIAAEAILETRFRSALAIYYATNAVRAYLDSDPKKPVVSVAEHRRKEAAAQSKAKTAELLVKMVEKAKLLGMLAPNGKPLAHCTIAECRQFGGWYLGLAEGKPEGDTVAAHYSEAELHDRLAEAGRGSASVSAAQPLFETSREVV